ncbi:unnamed protein product [Musa banksii]
MDLVKRELQKKRQMLQADFGGRKLLRRSEIEQKEIQRLRRQEQRHLQSKSHNSIPTSSYEKPSKFLLSERGNDDAAAGLPRDEVVRRLRILKQPATLFGEDDAARFRRLQAVIESGPIEVEEEIADGQTNDFLRDIYELRRRQRPGILPERALAKREGAADGRLKGDFEELCDEDKILVFFSKLLSEWGQEVEEMPEAEKRTAKGKFVVATFNQCARYLKPMFRMCGKKILPGDVRQALVKVVQRCMKRDYLAAMDEYIRLAISNAPWPIGVTMVGIHESSAHEKI